MSQYSIPTNLDRNVEGVSAKEIDNRRTARESASSGFCETASLIVGSAHPKDYLETDLDRKTEEVATKEIDYRKVIIETEK